MPRHQPVIAALAVAALALAACERLTSRGRSATAGTVTLVNRVRGQVRCVTGSNCEPSVAAALRPRVNAAAITVRSDRTVDIEFEHPATAFSSASFRKTVGDAGAEVVAIGIEACGTIDTVAGRSWIATGSTRLLIDGPGSFADATEMCVTGELRDQGSPPRLVTGGITF